MLRCCVRICYSNIWIEYKVSVQDVINSGNSNNDDWGLEGYQFPKFNAFMEKPPGFKIIKTR
jgi:hypothetical protein